MDPMTRSVLIVVTAVVIQMALASWQARAVVDYAKRRLIIDGDILRGLL